MYTELLNERKLGSVINTLLRIIGVTFVLEAIGALLIYIHASEMAEQTGHSRFFFALFHSISAFCNAGFSNLPDGLYASYMRFNYPLMSIFTILFILGGLGFSMILNLAAFAKRWSINLYQRIFCNVPFSYRPWVINFNSRLIAWTTAFLILFGVAGMFLLELNNTLAEHDGFLAKLTSSFFLASTPRSAGFNNVDMLALGTPTVMLIIFLMWVGASPASTGGGIKTTTFAVALLNLSSLVRGKDRVEVFGREISPDSVRRSYAVILLSFVGIGLAVFALCITDGDKEVRALAFEAFSAYGTVGLSLGITPELSYGGKIVLSITMFVGRVGMLTLLVAMIREVSVKNYRYPQERVLF